MTPFSPVTPSPRHPVTGSIDPTGTPGHRRTGFTLIEIMLGAAMLIVAVVALMGALVGQNTLTEHARNLTLAMNDGNRVLEEMRRLNTGCTVPSAIPPNNFKSWDAWLADATANGGGGISIRTEGESIAIACRNQDGTDYCAWSGANPQVGELENRGGWTRHPANQTAPFDPIQVTVSVGWRQRNRTMGQFRFTDPVPSQCKAWTPVGGGCGGQICTGGWTTAVPGGFNPDESVSVSPDTAGVIDSPAMLTTWLTCRE